MSETSTIPAGWYSCSLCGNLHPAGGLCPVEHKIPASASARPARDGETREDFHAWEHAPQDELIRSIAYTLDDLMRFWAHPDNVELIQRTRRHLDRQFAEFDRRMAMPPARDGETLSDERLATLRRIAYRDGDLPWEDARLLFNTVAALRAECARLRARLAALDPNAPPNPPDAARARSEESE